MTDWDDESLSDAISSFARETAVPGISAAVVSDRGTIVAELWDGDPGGRPTGGALAFCIGSVSKSLTSACLLRLRAEGLVDIDDRLDTYVPEVRGFGRWSEWGHAVTLRSLLQHTSGLQCDAPSANLRRWDPAPVDELLAEPHRAALAIPPESAFKYSNLGYELLGEVIARTSSQRYEETVRTRLLDPLSMDDTWLGPADLERVGGSLVEAAKGYGPLVDGCRDLADTPPRSDAASGGWWSTANDMATWVRFHLDGDRPDVLTDAALAECHRPTVDTAGGNAYGFGWRSYRRGSTTTIGHGGLTNGFEARIELDPARSLGVVVLLSAIGPDDTAERLAGQLMGFGTSHRPPSRPSRVDQRRDAEGTASGVSGSYQEVGFEWTVGLEESPLGVTLCDDTERWLLTPTSHPDRYVVPGGRCAGERLVVLRDDRGAVEAINVAGYPMTPVGA